MPLYQSCSKIAKRFALLLLLVPAALLAEPGGVLVGLITAGPGEALGNARIVLTNVNTGLHRETKTDELGIYAFSLLPPGEYRLEAYKAGNVARFADNIQLSAGEKRAMRLRWDSTSGSARRSTDN